MKKYNPGYFSLNIHNKKKKRKKEKRSGTDVRRRRRKMGERNAGLLYKKKKMMCREKRVGRRYGLIWILQLYGMFILKCIEKQKEGVMNKIMNK